tara:strand:+ start:193 stop:351 length:159 start_codon:yes stop_codon:yes gene_type:complete
MTIESVRVLRDNNGTKTGYIIDEVKIVPLAEDNTDYQHIQKWLEKGNKASEA